MTALTIARFTIQEAISRRLILAGVVLSLGFLALFAYGFSLLYSQTVEGNFARGAPVPALAIFGSTITVLGLYAVHFLAGFLALFVSVGAISGEIDSGTLYAVLARPIRRGEYVLGRWLAYVLLVSVYVAAMVASLLLIARAISGYEAPDAPRAIALMVLEAVLLVTLSLFGSTILATLANGVVVFSLFGLAWLAGIIEFVGDAIPNQSMVNLGIAVSLLIPSDAIWRGASYYVQSPLFVATVTAGSGRAGIPFASTVPPTTALVLWSLGYTALALVGAIAAFSRRDL